MRITEVMMPQPNAKTMHPVDVIGLVTMSVAMKIAPSMSPPVRMWKSGGGVTPGQK